MEKIKIFLSDPQVLFREGMHFTLSAEEDLEVTGETTNNEEALAFIETDPPNIAILNMKNGKLDGPTVTRRIKRTFPSVSVMLIADRDEEELLFAALKCGASAYLTKDVNPEYLLDLIRVISQGGQPIIEALMIPKLASRIQEEFEALTPLNKQFSNILANLSPREAEILGRITAGNDIKQIATGINSNEETIRKHLRSIVNKLVANDQARAVIDLAQQGLLPIAPDTGPVSGYAGYVTKNEFNEFKESLIQRLSSLIKGSP